MSVSSRVHCQNYADRSLLTYLSESAKKGQSENRNQQHIKGIPSSGQSLSSGQLSFVSAIKKCPEKKKLV